MAVSYEKAKTMSPTRPHPNAPNKPPFANVAQTMTAPLDALRDVARSAVRGVTSADVSAGGLTGYLRLPFSLILLAFSGLAIASEQLLAFMRLSGA
jgi:hypothetical protein